MYVVATAGHVDHGKSTLLRALTGTDPDRLAEERRRGLTLDLGFVSTTAPNGRPLAFVDVPGHHRYLATTFAGIATAPAVLLVVSADGGWCAQTSEHLAALDAFGVRRGLLVVTRADLADPTAALEEARTRTAGTGLEDAPAVAVSARTGDGLEELLLRLDALADAHPSAAADAPVRLWIDRAFTVAGAGAVVTGTLTAGTLSVEDEVELAPAGVRAAVRGLQRLGQDVDQVTGPARVAVNLRRVAAAEIRRGHALVAPDRWWRTSTVDVRFHRQPPPDPRTPGAAPRPPAEPLVHCGTATTSARLRPLGADSVRLTLRTPLDLHVGDRLLVRDPGSRLLWGATVWDVAPPRLRGPGAAALRAGDLAAASSPTDAALRIRTSGPLHRRELTAMGFTLEPDDGPQHAPEDTPHVVSAGPYLVDAGHAARLRAALQDQVETYAAAHPADPGLPVPQARRHLALPDAFPLTALTGEGSFGDGLLAREGRIYRAQDAESLPEHVAGALRRLLDALALAPFRALTRRQLEELEVTPQALALLVRRGRLERVGPHHLASGARARATARLGTLPQPFTVGEGARALATSRRVAVPLLETLDAEGVTRRHADGRRSVTGAATDAT